MLVVEFWFSTCLNVALSFNDFFINFAGKFKNILMKSL